MYTKGNVGTPLVSSTSMGMQGMICRTNSGVGFLFACNVLAPGDQWHLSWLPLVVGAIGPLSCLSSSLRHKWGLQYKAIKQQSKYGLLTTSIRLFKSEL